MAYDSLPFAWTKDVFGTNVANMDKEHQGTALESRFSIALCIWN